MLRNPWRVVLPLQFDQVQDSLGWILAVEEEVSTQAMLDHSTIQRLNVGENGEASELT